MHKGSQALLSSFQRELGIVSRRCRGTGPCLGLRGESSDVSPVMAGRIRFLLTCDGNLREPLMVPQECHSSFRVARGTSGFFLCSFRGIGLHLELRGESRGVSRVEAGSFGSHSSFNGDLREPLMLPQGSQAFRVVRGTLGFLSSHCRKIGLHVELRWEIQCSSPVVMGSRSSYRVSKGESGLILF